jgi:hypothetical protein
MKQTCACLGAVLLVLAAGPGHAQLPPSMFKDLPRGHRAYEDLRALRDLLGWYWVTDPDDRYFFANKRVGTRYELAVGLIWGLKKAFGVSDKPAARLVPRDIPREQAAPLRRLLVEFRPELAALKAPDQSDLLAMLDRVLATDASSGSQRPPPPSRSDTSGAASASRAWQALLEPAFRSAVRAAQRRWPGIRSYGVDYVSEDNRVHEVDPPLLRRLAASGCRVRSWLGHGARPTGLVRVGPGRLQSPGRAIVPITVYDMVGTRYGRPKARTVLRLASSSGRWKVSGAAQKWTTRWVPHK